MTRAFTTPQAITASSLILTATRGWRSARDNGRPTLAALYETLDRQRYGILAPVFASLIALYESCAGRAIRVGGPHLHGPSADERRLLGLLDGSRDAGTMALGTAGSSLARALGIAVQSTRIMLRLALDSVGNASPSKARPTRRGVRARRPRIAAFRNEPVSAMVDRLRGTYRVTARILGEPRFGAAALAFARKYRPADPAASDYGRGFADFLAEQPAIADIPHLADVATLERLWTEAHLAADAPVLEIGDLADGDQAWTARRVQLHPATRFVWLSTSAVTLWQMDGDGSGEIAVERRAEGALVTRRDGRVALRPITRPEHRLLSGLRLGERIGEASQATAALYPEADIASVFADLVGSGAFARPPRDSFRPAAAIPDATSS